MEVACPINLDPFSLKIFEVRILKIVSGEHFFQFLCTRENISQCEYNIVGGGKGAMCQICKRLSTQTHFNFKGIEKTHTVPGLKCEHTVNKGERNSCKVFPVKGNRGKDFSITEQYKKR